MKGKYSKGKYLWVRFDLTGGKELGEAYYFFCGGVPEAVKHLTSTVTKEELSAICSALQRDALEHNERLVAATRYDICTRCGREIDLQAKTHEPDPDYPGMGLFRHKKCPPRRDVYRFDL